MFGIPNDVKERLAAERPVVVMGRGHSGTRVLAWALEQLGVRMGTLEEKATGDAQDRRFTRRIKRLARRSLHREATARPTAWDVRRFRRSAWRFLQWIEEHPPAGAPPRRAWGWKFPETYMIGPIVEEAFPLAKHIHMVRDGRDLAFKEHLTDDAERGLGRDLLRELDALDAPHHVQAAKSWDFQVRRFGEFEQSLGARSLRLRFEDLLADPQREMARVAEFLELEMNAECRAFLEKNIRRGKISQHREEDPEQIAMVESLIAPTLREWGYELASSTTGAEPQ